MSSSFSALTELVDTRLVLPPELGNLKDLEVLDLGYAHVGLPLPVSELGTITPPWLVHLLTPAYRKLNVCRSLCTLKRATPHRSRFVPRGLKHIILTNADFEDAPLPSVRGAVFMFSLSHSLTHSLPVVH